MSLVGGGAVQMKVPVEPDSWSAFLSETYQVLSDLYWLQPVLDDLEPVKGCIHDGESLFQVELPNPIEPDGDVLDEQLGV